MKIKRAILAAIIPWTLGASAYIGSYFFTFMADPEMQANIILAIAMIPSAVLGARFYYKKGTTTNGFKLGTVMFLTALGLDALITVPVFITPAGGSHQSFFGDAGFWVIGLEYIGVVGIYSVIRLASRTKRQQISK